jgi:hypothetical protein
MGDEDWNRMCECLLFAIHTHTRTHTHLSIFTPVTLLQGPSLTIYVPRLRKSNHVAQLDTLLIELTSRIYKDTKRSKQDQT